MRCVLALAVAALALPATACLRTTEFHCSANTECGAGGVCAPMGLCSVVDNQCTSGLRFSDTAGSHANECVDGNGPIDARIDGPPGIDSSIDSAIDGPPSTGCPAGYNTITGGQAGHLYRKVTATDQWDTQRLFCTATTASAYLAIPDTLGELQAMATLAATAVFWVGITDAATENTFLTVKGTAQTFLPWAAGAPDNGPPPENCVEIVSATSQINDERCSTQLTAICECEP